MEAFLIYFVSYGIILFGWWLLLRQVHFLIYPTIPTFYFAFQTLFIAAGMPAIFLSTETYNWTYFLGVLSACLLLPIGCWLTNHVLKFEPREEMETYLSKPIVLGGRGAVMTATWIIFFGICTIVCMAYLRKLSAIPIIEILLKNPTLEEASELREASTAGFAGKYHRYSLVFYHLLPLTTYTAIVMAFIKKNTRWRFLAICSGLFAAFMLLATSQKAPLVMFVLSVVILFIWTSEKRRALKIIVSGIFMSIGLISILYFLLYFRTELALLDAADLASQLFSAIGRRLTLSQTYPLEHTFAVFPFMHDFLYGQTFPNPGGVFPHSTFPLSTYMFELLSPHSSIRGTANTIFFGEIYANFGVPLMLVGQLLIGSVLQFLHIAFVRTQKDVLGIVFMLALMVLLSRLTQTGLGVLLLPLPLYIVLLFGGRGVLRFFDQYKLPSFRFSSSTSARVKGR